MKVLSNVWGTEEAGEVLGWTFLQGDCRLPYGSRRLIEEGGSYFASEGQLFDEDIMLINRRPIGALQCALPDSFVCVRTVNSGNRLSLGLQESWTKQTVVDLWFAHLTLIEFWKWQDDHKKKWANRWGERGNAKLLSMLEANMVSHEAKKEGAGAHPPHSGGAEQCR